MTDYFFLASALPSLKPGIQPDITFPDFKTLCHDNLTAGDKYKFYILRLYYDLENMRAFWKDEPLDEVHGNYDKNQLKEAMLTTEMLPDNFFDFFNEYDTAEKRLHHFPKLLTHYYQEYIPSSDGFLKWYLSFEREWRLVFAALRAKKLKRDILAELQYEDPHDTLIAQILAQKDAANYEPPEEYEQLKAIYNEHENDPIKLYQAIQEWRYYKIKEKIGTDTLSTDRILAYAAQLIAVERWQELDSKKGLQVVDNILKVKL